MTGSRLLLGVFALLLLVFGSSAAAQPALQPADSTIVRTASALTEEGAAISEVWPGFWSANQAFLVLRPPETALLVTPRTPPETYASVPPSQVPASLRERAYRRSEYPPDLGSRTFKTRYAVGQDTIPALPPKGSSFFDRLDFYLHESFHGYQRTHWAKAPGDTIRVRMGEHLVNASITKDPTFRVQGEVERRILSAALNVSNQDSLRSLLRSYLAVRRMRTEGHERVRAVERSMERREGTATYVGCQAAAVATRSETQRGRSCIRKHITMPLDSLKGFPEADARLMRWRQYGTGAVLCVVLDQLEVPQWQERVARGTSPDQLVQAALAFDDRRADRLRQIAFERFGYPALLERERADQ